MKCNFVVGQKVAVKIGGKWYDQYKTYTPMKEGDVYTIKSIHALPNGVVGLGLTEIVTDDLFDHTGFAPVIERKTDISIFTKMLRPVEERVP